MAPLDPEYLGMIDLLSRKRYAAAVLRRSADRSAAISRARSCHEDPTTREGSAEAIEARHAGSARSWRIAAEASAGVCTCGTSAPNRSPISARGVLTCTAPHAANSYARGLSDSGAGAPAGASRYRLSATLARR